jgi:hypothetical protein
MGSLNCSLMLVEAGKEWLREGLKEHGGRALRG